MSAATTTRMPHVIDVHVPWRAPHHPACEQPLLEGVDLASPLHKGYMFKEAHSHLVFHKRFFVLFPRVLVYYEKESDYKRDLARGSLEHRHRAIGLEGVYLSKPEKKVKGAKFCFILHAPDKRNERQDFLLVSENKDEWKHWIHIIQDQNPNLINTSHCTQAGTPQRGCSTHNSETEQSCPVTTTITSVDPDNQSNMPSCCHPNRPGSPRHNMHRLDPNSHAVSGSTDYLDIQHLDIREGTSDTEDGSSNN